MKRNTSTDLSILSSYQQFKIVMQMESLSAFSPSSLQWVSRSSTT